MGNIKLCFDNQNHSAKPQGRGIAQISQRIAYNTVTIDSSESEKAFIQKVGLQVHTVTNSV